MSKFKKIGTSIKNLVIVEPTVFGDPRGFFMETYNKKDFSELGINQEFVQDNHSKSKQGVLRGLHFQSKHPQGKLIRVVHGAAYDVAVDLRNTSPTYGQYFGLVLSDENRKMLYVPEGFAHGFLAVSNDLEFVYKATDYYYPEYDAGIIWNDPDINVTWPFKEYGIAKPIISSKDEKLPRLRDIQNLFNE